MNRNLSTKNKLSYKVLGFWSIIALLTLIFIGFVIVKFIETRNIQTMDDLINVGCKVLTIGQYLQPTKKHLTVKRYVTPEEFLRYKEVGLEKGFQFVESGPLVRSSYRAERHI